MNCYDWVNGYVIEANRVKCSGLPEMTVRQPEEVAHAESSVNRQGLR